MPELVDETLFERAVDALIESGLSRDDAVDMTTDALSIQGVRL